MPGTYPRITTARQARTTWSSKGSPGENGPFAVVTQMYAIAQAPEDADVAPGTDPRTQDPRLQNLQEQLGAARGWFRPANPWSAPMAESPPVRVVLNGVRLDKRTEQLRARPA